MKLKKIFKIFLFLFILGLFILPNFVLAEKECADGGYALERPIFGFDCAVGPAEYVVKFYPIALGLGIFAAAIMIVYSGVMYSLARDDVTKTKENRQKILVVLGGVFLLLGVVLILNVINPDLTDPQKWQDNISFSRVAKVKEDPLSKCGPAMEVYRACYTNCLKSKTSNECLAQKETKICEIWSAGSCVKWKITYSWTGDCAGARQAVENVDPNCIP